MEHDNAITYREASFSEDRCLRKKRSWRNHHRRHKNPVPPQKAKLEGNMEEQELHARYFFSLGSMHSEMSLPTLLLGEKGFDTVVV